MVIVRSEEESTSLLTTDDFRRAQAPLRVPGTTVEAPYAPNGLNFVVPLKIWPTKLKSSPPVGVVRLMKSNTLPS